MIPTTDAPKRSFLENNRDSQYSIVDRLVEALRDMTVAQMPAHDGAPSFVSASALSLLWRDRERVSSILLSGQQVRRQKHA